MKYFLLLGLFISSNIYATLNEEAEREPQSVSPKVKEAMVQAGEDFDEMEDARFKEDTTEEIEENYYHDEE